MNISNIQLINDTRSGSISISCITTIEEYLSWYNQHGKDNKLDDQRPVLNTRSANMVRKRLIDDLTKGAVIPPIVIGMTSDDISNINENSVEGHIQTALPNGTVIDGIQRTEALLNAVQQKQNIGNNNIRIEFWIAKDVVSLIYRMLVLNSGQTPWDTKRQLEVIYKPLLKEVENRIESMKLNYKNDKRRRNDGGIYQASSIVELYMAFSSRKELVSTTDKLSDEFTRLDIVEMSGEPKYSLLFYEILSLLVQFDNAICKYRVDNTGGICSGMDLFTQMPSKVGFIVALAQYIVGRSGEERPNEIIEAKKDKAKNRISAIIDKVESLGDDDLAEFLSFDILNEKIASLDKKKIGNAQREYYKKAFSEMLDMEEVDNLRIVWLSV